MSRVFVMGCGAVSPAGWGTPALRQAVEDKTCIPAQPMARPGWVQPLRVRPVPNAATRPAFLSHARLRRASPISQYTVASALEALGNDASRINAGSLRLGIVLCVMSGCVNYSRRFYDEVLRNPGTASPIIFPETVFNAPASHLAALLGTQAISYTLVGDPAMFLSGLALAANWLAQDRVDGCLVIGAEELDWLTADAYRLFESKIISSEGAGALYLRREPDARAAVELSTITDAHSFSNKQSRRQASKLVRLQLPPLVPGHLLCDSTQNLPSLDAAELAAWDDWTGPRIAPKTVLGEGLAAASAWQCVLAVDAIKQTRCSAANLSIVGCNQQAIGAHFAMAG